MSAEKVILALLEDDAAVDALVGGRIYGDAMPEGDPLPALVFNVITDVPTVFLDSASVGGPYTGRIQVNAMAGTRQEAKALMAAAIAACHLKSGAIGGVAVNSIVSEGEGPSGYDRQVGVYYRSVDFIVNCIT